MSDSFPYIIAEIANAHNGDFNTLKNLTKKAIATKADAIKFQWFSPDTLSLEDFEWYSVYQKLMFSEEQWDEIINICSESKIDIWVDATDSSALNRIDRHKDKIHGLKIAATAFLDMDFAIQVLSFGKKTLIGIGGHEDQDIIKYANLYRQYNPDIILQHGVQSYPTLKEDATLARIRHLENLTALPQAFADHEDGASDLALKIPEYAYFAGADIIEKHICLDRSSKPYDYFSSLEPSEFTKFVSDIKNCTVIKGATSVTDNQRKYLKASTFAIANSNIKGGDLLTKDFIKYRRTSQTAALSPADVKTLAPMIATTDIKQNTCIKKSDVKQLNIVAVIPCRMKSKRLKQKALLDIEGATSIERCVTNAEMIPGISKVVIVTSNHPDDNPLQDLANAKGIDCIRGSEDDVLERMLIAGEKYNPDIMLRITGDCPMVSFEMMEYMIEDHIRTGSDASYCHTNVPVGTVGDVYSYKALQRLRELVPNTNFSEYLIMYFINNPKYFKVNEVTLPKHFQHPEWRLTLDEQADLDLMRNVYAFADINVDTPIAFTSTCNFFAKHPEAVNTNSSSKLVYKTDQSLIDQIRKNTTIL